MTSPKPTPTAALKERGRPSRAARSASLTTAGTTEVLPAAVADEVVASWPLANVESLARSPVVWSGDVFLLGVVSSTLVLLTACTTTSYPCEGFTVPGDYASLQAAMSALAPVNGGSICLSANAYLNDTTLVLDDGFTTLEIGVLKRPTYLMGTFRLENPDAAEVTVRGVEFRNAVEVVGSATFIDVTFDRSADEDEPHPTALKVFPVAGRSQSRVWLERVSVRSDGSGVIGTNTFAPVWMPEILGVEAAEVSGAVVIDVRSSRIEAQDVGVGLYPDFVGKYGARPTIRLFDSHVLNCSIGVESRFGDTDVRQSTLEGNATAFSAVPVGLQGQDGIVGTSRHRVGNSLFLENDLALSAEVGIHDVRVDYNAVWGNLTNYQGVVPYSAFVNEDPRLEPGTSPPRPQIDSPLLGAGTNNFYDTATDFHGDARRSPPTIGAVEMAAPPEP